jgi:hypothetical protein
MLSIYSTDYAKPAFLTLEQTVADGVGLESRDFAQGRFCERLRMPAMRTARHTPPAGVRKRPREEIAGGERRACGWRYGDWSAAHAVVDAG